MKEYIKERFKIISSLKENWYQEGDKAFDREKVNYVRDIFLENFKGKVLGFISPFPDRMIHVEWDYTIDGISYNLEFSSEDLKGFFYILDMNDDSDSNDIEMEVDLNEKSDWDKINKIINDADFN